MLDITGTTLAVLVFIGISSVVSIYCVICFLCRRINKRAIEDDMPQRKIFGASPRRFVEIRPHHLHRHSPQDFDHPIIQRTQVPFSSARSQMTTIAVIDLRTKLSLNPKTEAEEPPPSYDELFP